MKKVSCDVCDSLPRVSIGGMTLCQQHADEYRELSGDGEAQRRWRRERFRAGRVSIYVRPEDQEIFDWARNTREGLSDTVARALALYRFGLEHNLTLQKAGK